MRSSAIAAPLANPTPSQIDVSGARSDARLVDLWLSASQSENTRKAYARDVAGFFAFVGKPLRSITMIDVQAWVDGLDGAATSRARRIAAVKSLLSFAHRAGYLTFNVGAAVRQPKIKATLAERILTEGEVIAMIALACGRDAAILRCLYVGGLRASELCGLRWHDLQSRDNAGQVTVFGKGGKTRVVLLTAATWKAIDALRPMICDPAAFVFVSRTAAQLDESAVWRVIRKAASAAGIDKPVSPHWLRHSHASHSLERGVALTLIRDTLGHADISTTGKYLHARPGASSGQVLPA